MRLHHLRDRDACTPETVDNLVCAQRAAPVRDVAIEGVVVLSPPSLAQLRAFAAAAGLAAHKLPARLVIVDDFPRTSAGKVHKRALPTLLA